MPAFGYRSPDPVVSPNTCPRRRARRPSSTGCTSPSGRRSYAPLLPVLPQTFRRMPLGEVDVVLTSHHAFAAQVVFATQAPVVAYVHSPARWAWDAELRAGEACGRISERALTAMASRTRRDELAAAPRLGRIIANSTAVAHRIRCCWGESAEVVHPPVDTEFYQADSGVDRQDY